MGADRVRRRAGRARSPGGVQVVAGQGPSLGRRAAAARRADPGMRKPELRESAPHDSRRPQDAPFPQVAPRVSQPGQDLLPAWACVRRIQPHSSRQRTSEVPCLPPRDSPALQAAGQGKAGRGRAPWGVHELIAPGQMTRSSQPCARGPTGPDCSEITGSSLLSKNRSAWEAGFQKTPVWPIGARGNPPSGDPRLQADFRRHPLGRGLYKRSQPTRLRGGRAA